MDPSAYTEVAPEELRALAPYARSYSERIAGNDTRHVSLLIRSATSGRFISYSGTISESEASEVLNSFDPHRTIRSRSRSSSAEPTYYRPPLMAR